MFDFFAFIVLFILLLWSYFWVVCVRFGGFWWVLGLCGFRVESGRFGCEFRVFALGFGVTSCFCGRNCADRG